MPPRVEAFVRHTAPIELGEERLEPVWMLVVNANGSFGHVDLLNKNKRPGKQDAFRASNCEFGSAW
jgi:hypothetical protein